MVERIMRDPHVSFAKLKACFELAYLGRQTYHCPHSWDTSCNLYMSRVRIRVGTQEGMDNRSSDLMMSSLWYFWYDPTAKTTTIAALPSSTSSGKDLVGIMTKLDELFLRAADSGEELSLLLEVTSREIGVFPQKIHQRFPIWRPNYRKQPHAVEEAKAVVVVAEMATEMKRKAAQGGVWEPPTEEEACSGEWLRHWQIGGRSRCCGESRCSWRGRWRLIGGP